MKARKLPWRKGTLAGRGEGTGAGARRESQAQFGVGLGRELAKPWLSKPHSSVILGLQLQEKANIKIKEILLKATAKVEGAPAFKSTAKPHLRSPHSPHHPHLQPGQEKQRMAPALQAK